MNQHFKGIQSEISQHQVLSRARQQNIETETHLKEVAERELAQTGVRIKEAEKEAAAHNEQVKCIQVY